jgi:predicted dehydrogenase
VARICEDQLAFSGTLDSGAVVSFHFRAGLSAAAPGRVPFEWIIDGEKGTIKIEGSSSVYHVAHPQTVLINGERWEPQEKLVDFTGNVAAAWAEIAKGDRGDYATFEYAVRVHRVIDAIRRSAREGVKVDIK